jgi:hypothetical protein
VVENAVASSAESSYHLAYHDGSEGTGDADGVSRSVVGVAAGRVLAFGSLHRLVSCVPCGGCSV